MTNLLKNHSFENGWTDIPVGQQPKEWVFTPYERANPITPNAPFLNPEIRVLPKAQLPAHERDLFVLDGDYCFKAFKGDAPWNGTMRQVVNLEPGFYELGIRIYADAVIAYDHNTKIPPTDIRACRVRLTVNDGEPSPWRNQAPLWYNRTAFPFYANGETVLKLEFMMPLVLKTNGVFCDKWQLTLVHPVPKQRGAPRVQYNRVYRVLPADATPEQATAVLLDAMQKNRQTVGFSYDDAGMGDLDNRTAMLYGIGAERLDVFRHWYDTYYPGTNVQFANYPGDPEPPPPPVLGELLSIHLQTEVDGWLEYVQRVKPAWVKLVGGMELAEKVKAVSPKTKVVYRHYVSNQGAFLNDVNPRAAARAYLDMFWEGIAKSKVDCVESLNETIATGDIDGIKRAVAFDCALSDEVYVRAGYDIAACLLNVAVGNPDHGAETALLLPVAEKAVQHRHRLGYHSYFPCTPQLADQWMESEGIHHHMRALLSWDVMFGSHGVKPRYLFTECGAVAASVRPDGKPGHMDPIGGWRAKACLNSDLDHYIRLLLRWRQLVAAWNAQNGNRAEGAHIFTTGAPFIGWEKFIVNGDELDKLAGALGK